MPAIRFLLLLGLIGFQDIAAQQNNIRYFGKKAGLNFSQSPPAPKLNSEMDTDKDSSNNPANR